MKKFKGVFLLLIILILSSVGFGCNNEKQSNEFRYAQRIQWTVEGEEPYLAAAKKTYEFYEDLITLTEYENAPSDKRVMFNPWEKYEFLPIKTDIPEEHNGKLTYTVEEYDMTSYENITNLTYYYSKYDMATGITTYYKSTYKNSVFNLYMIKVVDKDTIIIRDKNGETTYDVIVYHATYFE